MDKRLYIKQIKIRTHKQGGGEGEWGVELKGNKRVIGVDACVGPADPILWAEECEDFNTPEVPMSKTDRVFEEKDYLLFRLCLSGAWRGASTTFDLIVPYTV